MVYTIYIDDDRDYIPDPVLTVCSLKEVIEDYLDEIWWDNFNDSGDTQEEEA
jgi:hypothetical protein